MKMDQEKIYNLIGKELKGEASQEEIRTLQDWKDQDIHNASLYEQVGKIWEKYKSIPADAGIDTFKSWDKLEQLIDQSDDSGQHWLFRASWKVAASIIIVFSLTFLLYQLWYASEMLQLTTTEVRSDPLILEDGSAVWLNRNSTFFYPETFNTDTRTVRLIGEAYFEIQPDKNKPFIIQSDYGAEAMVVGTAFNYFAGPDSSLLSVTEGIVRFASGDRVLTLNAEEEGVFNNDHFEKRSFSNPNTLAWKTGILQFNKAPLTNVMRDLADHYAVNITSEVLYPDQCTLSSIFDDQKLTDVLDEITLVLGLEWKQETENLYIVQGSGCQ